MNITLHQTCGACPEQYDARDETGRKVGYLRLRHGVFTVEAIGEDGEHTEVYRARPDGHGVFDPDERGRYLARALVYLRSALLRSFDPESSKEDVR